VNREVEQIEQITDRRRIARNIEVLTVGDRVLEIVTAALADSGQIPITLDELQD